ncbi:hypothetical protein Tco_0502828 [Tanacetum coccineum]
MSWFSRCSWCGGPFNGGNCRQCTIVSFRDEFVCNPDPISNDETHDFSYPPSQPQTSLFDQFHCFHHGDPLKDGVRYQRSTCERCGYYLGEGFCSFCNSEAGNSFVYDSNPNSFNDPPNIFNHPPQPQYESYSCELCGNDAHYGYDRLPRFPLRILQREQAANVSTHTLEPSRRFNIIYDYDDDDEESTIPLNEITSQIPPFIPVLPTMEPEDSLIMRDKDLSTIPEKESDKFIKSSVEDLVPIPSESGDTSGNDSECNLPSYDDFSPINVPEGKSMTFSNPLFDSNNDFTSSDDESLSDEDVLEDNVKFYSNPLFEFDDEYISSDVNPLFDEAIESKDSYVSNLDESVLLVTPLSDANEDECFDPGGKINEIDAFLDIDVPTDIKDGYHDLEGDIIYFESLLINDTFPNLPPEVFLDRDPRSLEDEPNKDDLKNIVKVFDPRIWEKNFSPTYVKLPFEDRHYLSLTYVIRIFLPYFTYPVDSSLPLSSRSEDIIFDPGIHAYSFYSLEQVCDVRRLASSFLVFRGLCLLYPDCPDLKIRARAGFVNCSLDLQSLYALIYGI